VSTEEETMKGYVWSTKTRTQLLRSSLVVSIGLGLGRFPLSAAGAQVQCNWTSTGSMATPRVSHTATPLPNGKVLIAGGANADGKLASAEVYDPATGMFTPTGSMNAARATHAMIAPGAALGRIFVIGGDVGAPTAPMMEQLLPERKR
jgi:hypothetical protein